MQAIEEVTLARYSLGMNYQEEIREVLIEAIEQSGLYLTDLAGRVEGLTAKNLSQFKTRRSFLGPDLTEGLARVLHVDIREIVARHLGVDTLQLSGVPGSGRLVPAIDARIFPVGAPFDRLLPEILKRPHAMYETSSQDPQAFYLILDERAGRRAEPGDRALVLPSVAPMDGRFVAIEVEGRAMVGRYLLVGESPLALLSDGRRVQSFRVLGSVLEFSARMD